MIRVNEESLDYEPGLTVGTLLERQGLAATMVAVWVDDVFIARSEYAVTVVGDGSEVRIVLMIAGG